MRRSMKTMASAAVLALFLLLSGCAAEASPSSSSALPPSESSSLSAPSAAAGPPARIPLEDRSYIAGFADPPPEDIPQLVCKDDTAARLARAVEPLIWFAASVDPPSFDSDHPLDADLAARIAFDNTPRLDFGGLSFGPDGFHCDDYPDHPITKRIARLWEDEHQITCDVIYAADADAALERLFGITGWEHHTVDYYNYFPEEGVYITYGDLIRGTAYPQLLSWEESVNGYSCEIIVTDARFGTVGDGIQVTEANIREIAALVPHYTYTFDMTTGEPVVTAITQSQKGLADIAGPLVDDYLWSGTPKAQAVGPITTATLHQAIPQYRYQNGALEPYELGEDYPVSANGKVFGIFKDMHVPELGHNRSFSSEYAEALTAFAGENDRVCIVYDDLGGWFFSPDARELFLYGPEFSEEKLQDPSLDSFQNAQVDITGIQFYPTQHTPSIGGLYFDPETWAKNWDSVPQSWKDAVSGADPQ